ncbi:restriction endonuclease subunit S [Haemophilus parahaemolyticus]|uniref:restriction endonuclease subunit S n=1 Tax=Haemophilus parahaemolyticus TaxID=735 RepID=UPI00352F8B9E
MFLAFILNTIPWEQRKLGDICNITTGKLDANAMVENGKYDFFTSGIKKYKIDHYAFLGPALTIAGNGATVGYMHYADGFFNAYQRTYVLTELLGDRTFLFSTINRKLQKKIQQEARAGNIPYIVLDMLTELDIYLPSLEEQIQIGNFFKQLDDTIALHQREFEKFKILRKAYLKHIFIDDTTQFRAEKTIPWEQRKLGEFVSSLRSGLSRMLDSEDIGLPVIRANNINNGYVDLENDIKYWYQIDPMGANTRNYLVAKDDILINFINSESRMGSAAIMRSIPSRDTIYTTNILRLRLTSDLDPYWFYIQTQSKLYLEYIKSISKVAVNQASFTTVEFKNFTFFCPSTKEQTQIGNFFKQLDDTIALHQKELAKYQQIKTACLEKMFVE